MSEVTVIDGLKVYIQDFYNPEGYMERIKFINLTPHELNIRDVNGEMQTIPASGQVARCQESRKPYLTPVGDFAAGSVSYGEVEGLPPTGERGANTLYIVSAIVLNAIAAGKKRFDVLAPGPAIRDENGKIIGADGLTGLPVY